MIKTLKKHKRTEFRNEVRRPANKKLRPKKYVEARIPNLPPVSTNQIHITHEKIITPISEPLKLIKKTVVDKLLSFIRSKL